MNIKIGQERHVTRILKKKKLYLIQMPQHKTWGHDNNISLQKKQMKGQIRASKKIRYEAWHDTNHGNNPSSMKQQYIYLQLSS